MMDVNRLITRLEASDESLPMVARGIGHGLPAATADGLRETRSALARSASRVSPDCYRAGYLDALRELTAAFERESHTAYRAKDAARAIRGTIAEKILRVVEPAELPSRIAARTGKDPSVVSRQLKRLREQGLVEQFGIATDNRRRPHRLTLLGRKALATLNPPLGPEATGAVEVTVHVMASLVQAGTASRSFAAVLAERLANRHGLDGQELLGTLLAAARGNGLIQQSSSGQLLTAHNAWERDQLLWLKRIRNEGGLRALLAPVLQEDLPERTELILRASGQDEVQWKLLLLDSETEPFSAVRHMRQAMAPEDRMPGGYVLLYDSPITLYHDLETSKASLTRALVTLCSASSDHKLPANVRRLEVPRAAA